MESNAPETDPRIAVWAREAARIQAKELPPNHKQPPKHHHYVPVVYLQSFGKSIAGSDKLRVRCVDRGSKVAKVIGVRDAAVMTDFYRIDTKDPRRRYEAEHLIGVFETAAGYAFNNLRHLGRTHFPDAIDRENLSLFMALQFVRGPDTPEFMAQAATGIQRMVLSMAASSPDYVRNTLVKQGRETSDEEIAATSEALKKAASTLTATPDQNVVVASMLENASEFFPFFYKRRWMIVNCPAPLLTSDRPIVLLERQEPSEPWRGVGLATADQIVYVLDRRRVLIMRHPEPGFHEGVVDGSRAFARGINRLVAGHSRRWIFHHPEDNPVDDLSSQGSP